MAQWTAFLIQRAGRALCDAGRYEEAERWLARFEEEPYSWFFAEHHQAVVPRIRALWDMAVCRDGLGDLDGALAYLERFLEHWPEPDDLAAPEIEEALFFYETLAGKRWGE